MEVRVGVGVIKINLIAIAAMIFCIFRPGN